MIPLVFAPYLNRRGKPEFIKSLRRGARLLDVGCGSNAPKISKDLRPDIYYVGIDVQNYNQDPPSALFADEYVLTTPAGFVERILQFGYVFDAIISSHNIEHCDNPQDVLSSIISFLKPNGQLFLSFPTEASVRFPRRRGTLNFYDDQEHKRAPNLMDIIQRLKRRTFGAEFVVYRRTIWSKGEVVNERLGG